MMCRNVHGSYIGDMAIVLWFSTMIYLYSGKLFEKIIIVSSRLETLLMRKRDIPLKFANAENVIYFSASKLKLDIVSIKIILTDFKEL